MWDSEFLSLFIISSSEHKKTSISYSLHAIFLTILTRDPFHDNFNIQLYFNSLRFLAKQIFEPSLNAHSSASTLVAIPIALAKPNTNTIVVSDDSSSTYHAQIAKSWTICF